MKTGDTFPHPNMFPRGWKPKCHVVAIVDEDYVVFKWYGRHKQWWHYEIKHRIFVDPTWEEKDE